MADERKRRDAEIVRSLGLAAQEIGQQVSVLAWAVRGVSSTGHPAPVVQDRLYVVLRALETASADLAEASVLLAYQAATGKAERVDL